MKRSAKAFAEGEAVEVRRTSDKLDTKWVPAIYVKPMRLRGYDTAAGDVPGWHTVTVRPFAEKIHVPARRIRRPA